MSVTASKPIDLNQLQAELVAAGIAVPALAASGGDLDATDAKTIHTYDAGGDIVDLPDTAQAVVDAHVSQRAAQMAQDTSDLAGLGAIRTAIAADVAALQTIRDAPDVATANLANLVAVQHAVQQVARTELRLIQVLQYLGRRAIDEGRL